MGIYYESERYVATDEKPALKNQASAFPGRGVNARRLDHINFLAKDVVANGEFIATALGGRESERIKLDDSADGTSNGYAAWWFRFNNKSYDVVYSDDWTTHGNRLHHIAFAPDTREDILKAADIFLENGIYIESGPHKHAINQTFFLYVWEPGGNRIELANVGARLLLDPDSPVVEWTAEERKKGQAQPTQTHSRTRPNERNERCDQ
jgi:catechol 2,3-dioxygenase